MNSVHYSTLMKVKITVTNDRYGMMGIKEQFQKELVGNLHLHDNYLPLNNKSYILPSKELTSCEIPLFESKVSAGFPSPAEEYVEGKLDLNKFLISNPPATFFVRATGDSMIGAGIYPDDILVVDRSIDPKEGKIVIAALDGDLTVKRFSKYNGKIVLKSENKEYPNIIVAGTTELVIWGVVTCVLHRV
jgi:DNA polymerase V